MEKIKIGFVPAHRVPFDENWAVEMRKRTLKALSTIESVEVIVSDENLTQNGLVRDDKDAEKVVQLFKKHDIDGIIIGTMTFGDEISAVAIATSFQECPVLLFGTKEGPFTASGVDDQIHFVEHYQSPRDCVEGRFPSPLQASAFRKNQPSLNLSRISYPSQISYKLLRT